MPEEGYTVATAQWGPAGQLLQMRWQVPGGGGVWVREDRTYNERLQMTRQTVQIEGGAVGMDMEYRFPTTGNNGRIESQKDNAPGGEEVLYQYDELSRLISAVTTGPEWGLAFTYDGFGNRLSQTVIKGTAPQPSMLYNAANNRVAGWSYDANGNATSMGGPMQMEYDGYNRMVRAVNVQGGGGESYGYDPENRRVYRWLANGEEQIEFYDAFGRRLETWRCVPNGWPRWQLVSPNAYFAGRLIASGGKAVAVDRLGSIRARAEWQVNTAVWVERHKYYPYGEERETTISNREKFATYHRDQSTSLDYAMNRYYAWPSARFTTPDPYKASAALTDPGSWNRYVYVQGDPVNMTDPRGLFAVAAGDGPIDFAPDLLPLLFPYETYMDASMATSDGGAVGSVFFHAALNTKQLVAEMQRQTMENWNELPEECRRGLEAALSVGPGTGPVTAAWLRLRALGNVGGQAGHFAKAAGEYGMDWKVLAAIAVVESSGLQNLVQPNGKGVGPMQIDLGQHPEVTFQQAMDLPWALSWAASELARSRDEISSRFPGISSELLESAMIAAYNLGWPAVVHDMRRGLRPETRSTGGNYSSKVLDIVKCF